MVTLDVREDIRSGCAPLSAVLNAVAMLRSGETLRLLAPFEPVPLYALLGRQGFQHTARLISESDWEVIFIRQPGAQSGESERRPSSGGGGSNNKPDGVIEVDARGLEPPQPLVKILEAAEALPPGGRLRARTDRRPMHLYAQLEERGFTGDSTEQADGSFITNICHR
jgi:uncharacterized protein (DUF2249 family)